MTEMTRSSASSNPSPREVRLLTHYAEVIHLIACRSDVRMRDLAVEVGISRRSVQHIIDGLVDGGYLSIQKRGTRNRYMISAELPLQRMLTSHRTVGDLIRFMQEQSVQDGAKPAS